MSRRERRRGGGRQNSTSRRQPDIVDLLVLITRGACATRIKRVAEPGRPTNWRQSMHCIHEWPLYLACNKDSAGLECCKRSKMSSYYHPGAPQRAITRKSLRQARAHPRASSSLTCPRCCIHAAYELSACIKSVAKPSPRPSSSNTSRHTHPHPSRLPLPAFSHRLTHRTYLHPLSAGCVSALIPTQLRPVWEPWHRATGCSARSRATC